MDAMRGRVVSYLAAVLIAFVGSPARAQPPAAPPPPPHDSNSTRLLFGPTGRSLAKGEGYIGVYEFLLPFVQVGVTDRFSMGAGTPLVFVGDDSAPPVWLTPKYQVYRGESTSAAAGVLHFVGLGSSSQVGIAYGVATTGTEDHAFTLGAGWAYARYRTTGDRPPCELPPGSRGCGEPAKTTKHVGSAVLMAGGERRVSRRIKVVSENYVFREGGIVSLGVRFLGKRLSADLGGFAPIGVGGFVLAPVVNFAWKFGR